MTTTKTKKAIKAETTAKINKSVKTRSKKQRTNKTKPPLWVIKIGSQLLMDGGPLLIRSLITEVSTLVKNQQLRIVWVSSGAIASARRRLNHQWQSLPEKQALSALGQPMLMELYNIALQSQGLMGGQVLLSYTDFRRPESRKNLKNCIFTLLKWKTVPILNENDVVATEEIQFGDNDQLSAMVACELNADRLIILTNVKGLYNKNPDEPDAEFISFVPQISSPLIKKYTSSSPSSPQKSELGKGGMQSKLLAAKRAWKKGIPTSIVDGQNNQKVLLRLFNGESLGTSIGKLI